MMSDRIRNPVFRRESPFAAWKESCAYLHRSHLGISYSWNRLEKFFDVIPKRCGISREKERFSSPILYFCIECGIFLEYDNGKIDVRREKESWQALPGFLLTMAFSKIWCEKMQFPDGGTSPEVVIFELKNRCDASLKERKLPKWGVGTSNSPHAPMCCLVRKRPFACE